MTLTLRSASTTTATTKAAVLTHAEMDANWLHTPAQLASSSGSSLVGFAQSGIGAVATSVQDELRHFIRPEQFGAVGDSTGTQGTGTDDAAALALASTAAAGKNLYFTRKYRISSNVTIGATVNCVFAQGAEVVADAGDTFLTSKNTFHGRDAGKAITTGEGNTVFGSQSGIAITDGTENTAIGYLSSWKLTTGDYNTGVGAGANGQVIVGSENTACGANALGLNTASNNTAVGKEALAVNTTGTPNTAVGRRAMVANIDGTDNTAVGKDVMALNTSGSGNVALGGAALAANVTASNSVAVGTFALLNATQGNNVAIGNSAGSATTTGSSNIFIGTLAQAAAVGDSNRFVAGSGTLRIDNVYFGKGPVHATPTAYTINGVGGTGSNIAGADLKLAGGIGTGSGLGGSVIIQTAVAGGSSSTPNTLADVLTITQSSNVGLGTATFGTNAVQVFSIETGTAPTTGPADTVQFYSSDDAAGHTIPSFFCEGTNVIATGQADSASSVRVKLRINGTVVTLLAI